MTTEVKSTKQYYPMTVLFFIIVQNDCKVFFLSLDALLNERIYLQPRLTSHVNYNIAGTKFYYYIRCISQWPGYFVGLLMFFSRVEGWWVLIQRYFCKHFYYGEKQILVRVIGIRKENVGYHAFFRDNVCRDN